MAKRLLSLLLIGLIYCTVQAQPGSYDVTFNPTFTRYGDAKGPDGAVRSIVPLPDGKLMVSGWFAFFNGAYTQRICRVYADGAIDNSFNPGNGANNVIQNMAVQPDGKVVAVGNFTTFNGVTVNRIVRLNTDGSIDNTFGTGSGADSIIRHVAVLPDGKILIAGWFSQFNGTSRKYILRLNTDGSIDNSFTTGTSANSYINAMLVLPDTTIIVGGGFTSFNGVSRQHVAKLNTDGTVDMSFNTASGANGDVISMGLQSDGKIMLGGWFTLYSGSSRSKIARINSNGSLDDTFDPGTGANSDVLTFAFQSDGKIIIGGFFTSFNGTGINRIARLTSAGSVDATFAIGTGATVTYTGGQPYVNALYIDPSAGKIYIGGEFINFDGFAKNHIVKLNLNGSMDLNFIPGNGANGDVNAFAFQSDGKIIIGGNFSNYNGSYANKIARLNADGIFDFSFLAATGVNGGELTDLIVDDSNRIYIIGTFIDYAGNSCNGIARLKSDGTYDSSFVSGTGFNDKPNRIIRLANGKLLVSGNFTSYNNNTINRVAVLETDGSLSASFNPGLGANAEILCAAVQPDGKILLGGRFTSFDLVPKGRLVRLFPGGTLDTTFMVTNGFDGDVNTIAFTASGKIIVGGGFDTFQVFIPAPRIIGLLPDGTHDAGFAYTNGASAGITALHVQADGKIIVGGNFVTYNGQIMNRITRLMPTGNFDYDFSTGGGSNHQVSRITTLPNDRIMVCGKFILYGGRFTGRIARLYGDRTIIIPSFASSYCKGQKITVPYTVTGVYDTANFFKVQLSDASGSFASATELGSVKGQYSGVASVRIPYTVANGTGYRVRVVSTSPYTEGRENGVNISISNCNLIEIDNLSTLTLCQGGFVNIPFDLAGTYNSGNVFTAELSDSSGSFSVPYSIGSITGTTPGVISAFIPSSFPLGSNYRIRINSSNPVVQSNVSGSLISIQSAPAVTLTSSKFLTFCLGDTATLFTNLSSTNPVKFQWLKDGNISNAADTFSTLIVGSQGNYSVRITAQNGCLSNSNAMSVLTPAPGLANFSAVSTSVCEKNNEVNFTDISFTSGITGRVWDVGNGLTFTDSVFSYHYPKAGQYKATLTIFYPNGCVDTASMFITIAPQTNIKFFANSDKQCLKGNSFQFYDSSNIGSGFYNREWLLGEGDFSTSLSPAKTFVNPGRYTIRLITTSDFGCADSMETEVEVYASPSAQFTITQANACLDKNYFIFNDKSTVPVGTVYALWRIPDLGTSFASNPGVQFTASGIKNIRLVAISDRGCTDTSEQSVFVQPNPSKPVISIDYQTNRYVLKSTPAAIYQWYYNSLPQPGAFFQTFNASSGGIYSVRVDSVNGCSNFSDPLRLNAIGVEDIRSSEGISVYPNPSQGSFNIEAEGTFSYELIDMNAKIVASGDKTATITPVDINGLSQGFYMLRIYKDGRQFTVKLVKE